MTHLAVDTSVAVPLLLRSHSAHDVVVRHIGRRRAALTGHSLVETYSVLTRLPGDARVAPADAVRLLGSNFDDPVLLDADTASTIADLLAPLGIAGGSVYDALVGLAAARSDLPLATRDLRAAATYAALDVRVEVLAG